MNEKNNNSTGAAEQQSGSPLQNNNSVNDTTSIADHDEGNTNNGELGGNFATFNQPVKSGDNGK